MTVIDTKPDAILLHVDTLAGDLRDMILDTLRHEHHALPWNMRPESDQRDTIERITSAVRRWVFNAVTAIAANNKPAIRGTLIKLQAKDGIQTQINVPASNERRHELLDHVGNTVLIMFADPEEYMGERGAVKIDKDQKTLLDEENDEGTGE